MPGITRERSMDRYGEEAAETSRPMHTSKKAKPDAGRNLYGTLHIPGVRVPAMDSSIGLWFLFEVGYFLASMKLPKLTLRRT